MATKKKKKPADFIGPLQQGETREDTPTPKPASGGGASSQEPDKAQPGPSQVFRNAQGRASGITLPDGRTFLGLSSEDVNMIQAGERAKSATPEGAIEISQAENIRRQRAGSEELVAGIEGDIGGLQEQIDQPLDLQPDPLLEDTAQIGLTPIAGIANIITSGIEKVTGKEFGRSSAQELSETAFGKILGNAIGGVALALGAVGGAAAIGVAATLAAKSTIIASVAAKTSGLGAALIGGGIAVGVGKTTEVEQGDIANARSIIAGMVEEGERIEADVRNGLDSNFAVERLNEMGNQISQAESIIKEKSVFNLAYRFDQDYLVDMQDIIKSREALRRRLRAVQNIAETGTAALNAEALMLNAAKREASE